MDSVPNLILSPTTDTGNLILQTLRKQQKYSQFTDFTIKTGEDVIHCHKNVMAATCPYFDTLLSSGMKEITDNEVHIDQYTQCELQHLLDYCYNGILSLEWESIRSCFGMFEYFQITKHRGTFIEYIVSHLNPSNCIGWFDFADKHGLAELKSSSRELMQQQFPAVTVSDEFKQLTVAELIDYVKAEKASIHPDDVMNGCITWLLGNPESINLSALLPHIDYRRCSLVCLTNVMSTQGDKAGIMDDASYKLISRCMIDKMSKGDDLLVVGGIGHGYKQSGKALTINTSTGDVKEFAELQDHIAACCLIPDGLFVIYYDSGTISCYIYKVKKKTWDECDVPIDDVKPESCACVDGKVYVLCTVDEDSSELLYIDLTDNSSVEMESPDEFLEHPVIVALQNQLYVMTNPVDSNNTELKLQRFDLETEEWGETSSLPSQVTNICGACLLAVGKSLYVVGGGGMLCLRYFPHSDQWIKLQGPNLLHINGAAAAIGDNIVLTGGLQGPVEMSDAVELYNAFHDKWQISQVKLPQPFWQHYTFPTPSE